MTYSRIWPMTGNRFIVAPPYRLTPKWLQSLTDEELLHIKGFLSGNLLMSNATYRPTAHRRYQMAATEVKRRGLVETGFTELGVFAMGL